MGGAEIAREVRAVLADRTDVRPRAAVCRRISGSRLHSAQRRGNQPGVGVLWPPGGDTRSDPARPGGGNLLVRGHRLARKDGHADQRFLLGDHGDGCGTQSTGDSPYRE